MLRAEASRLALGLPPGLQAVPVVPTIPSPEVRTLRASLILEEALETINALGISVGMKFEGCTIDEEEPEEHVVPIKMDDIKFGTNDQFNMVDVIDGCFDVKVVITGTLSAMGINDIAFQRLVDHNNLQKFAPGHTIGANGKLIKPPDHPAPNIRALLGELKLGILPIAISA